MALTEEEKSARREAREQARREQEEHRALAAGAQALRRQHDATRRHRWEQQADILRDLVPRALDALSEALAEGENPRLRVAVALAILRAAGLDGLGPPQIGDFRYLSGREANDDHTD